MLGNKLVTKQTPVEGVPVNMVGESVVLDVGVVVVDVLEVGVVAEVVVQRIYKFLLLQIFSYPLTTIFSLFLFIQISFH